MIVIGPLDIPEFPESLASQVLVQHANRWSAFTIKVDAGHLIVHNTTHEPPRQESNVMHELAHIWLKHKPDSIEPPGRLPFATRTFNQDQEDEAEWLGGCLQIPREAMLWFLQRRFDNHAIAAHFNASVEMVRFRRNTTGIDAQIARGTGRPRSNFPRN